MKILQEIEAEPNDVLRRLGQIVEVQQTRDKLYEITDLHQQKVKQLFDKRSKDKKLQVGDLVLKWDARREDSHGKFDSLWTGPFRIDEALDNNTFWLQNFDGEFVFGSPINGHFLKKFFC